MSIIAVKKYTDKIQICSDSQITRGNNKNTTSNKLCYINDDFIIGSVGLLNEGNLFNYFCKNHFPNRNDTLAILDLILEFNDWKEKKIKNSVIENHHIIIFDKTIYSHENFDVREITDYHAIGSGYNEALTALYLGKTVKEAVQVACELTLYCNPPLIEYTIKI
jgi:ATP-dependent protease HslVU (ClpYQ) peptidase subunit